jgi:hypothetical protein
VMAWSQTPGNLPVPPVPQNIPSAFVVKAPPTPALSGILSPYQRIQQAQASTNDPAAIISAQTPATALETAKYFFVYINIPNAAFVQPNAINNAAVVTGYYADANYNIHGFLWQQGTVQTIDYPGATATAFGGINNRGVLIGTYQDVNGGTYAVTYSLVNSAWTVLPDIPGGWQQLSGTVGINDDGVAVGCAGQFGLLSWIWHPDSQSYSYFTAPAAAEATTCGEGINNKGNVVGSLSVAYSNSSFVFLRKGGERYETIGLPSSLSGQLFSPFGINDSDTIVGTFSTATSASGFIRTRGGVFKFVNDPDYPGQTYVTGINDSGILSGDTYNPVTGQSPGFVAYPQE